jgi:flagella basal body P-ring formation protein FlgA
MGAEQAIRNYDVKPTLLVKRGQQVNFSVGEGRGFLITIKTEAQQDGSLGDQIKLKNVESGRFISGVITGLNEARAL